jgi:hypothetical protein
MSSTNTSNSTAEFFPTYKGPRKLVWEGGQQVMRPDLEAIAQGTPGSLQSYFVPKTIDSLDVVSETDEVQFSKLNTDSEKYDMIKGMITGAETKTDPPFKVSDPFVGGEYRELRTILHDLINKGKVWLNPKDGNLFEYTYAVANRMISFKCQYCSKISYTPEELRLHGFSHQQARRI